MGVGLGGGETGEKKGKEGKRESERERDGGRGDIQRLLTPLTEAVQ